jgi:DNA-binding transcriptional LysR family regulator
MDRIQAFQLFVRVVELGSFSKAASELGMTQPTATKLVAHLEARVGARLLHRTTRGVRPTEIGSDYYDKCRVIVHHVEEAEGVAGRLQSQLQGALRISTSVAFGRRVVLPLLLEFMRRHPGVAVELSCEDRYVNLVEQGVDVALRMGRLADSTLGARHLGINPWLAAASPDYLRRRGTPRVPDDLSNHDALIYSTIQADDRWRFGGPAGQVAEVVVRGPFRSNSLSSLLGATRAGIGVALLPWYVADLSVREGFLTPILADWSLPSQEIHAVFPSPRLVPAKVSAFVGWLEGQFKDHWWSRSDRDQANHP